MSTMKQTQDGFTIVEILVSIVVAAIIILSLNTVTNTYLHVSQKSRYLNLANSFAEAKMEELRNNGYNSLNVGTTNISSSLPSQLPPRSTASLTITMPVTGYKKLDLSVTYKDQGQSQTYGYTTYVGELGVGQ